MARRYLLILRIVNGLVFVLVLFWFFQIFHYDMILYSDTGEPAIFAFIIGIRNLLTYVIFSVLYFFVFIIILAISFGFYSVLGPLDKFFKSLFKSWFSFATPTGNPPSDIFELWFEILEELQIFASNGYLIVFQVFFVIAIYYAIRAVIKSNPKYNLRSIGSLMMMIIIPVMIFGLQDMLDLFGVMDLLENSGISVPILESLPDPVDASITHLPIDNLILFFVSATAALAISSYMYLELAFQINYTDLVTKPSLERSDRLEAQLSIIKRESIHVVANVDKIKEEAKKRKQELELKKESVGKFLAKTGTGFSYVKEMIEKKKLEAEEKKLVTAASKTRRLGSFLERLFREDPEAENTLTAKSAAPRATHLATSTILNFSIRFIILIIISFIIIHPNWFFVNLFNMPPAITESVAVYSPESIIILLLPIMLTFPVISFVISYIKHRNLMIRLKQEGQIKSIITSVGDYVKIEEEETKDDKKSKEDKEPTLTSEPTPETT
ncbi:MAG: hypothetical protein ACFFBP_20230 [Promethearchaeota archaeon]